MKIQSLEVYSHVSNYAVIKPPGRNYPGCVIQGDSLAILCQMAKTIATFAQSGDTSSKDFQENVQELANSLIHRILHYQEILAQHGIDLPYTRPFSEADLVHVTADD
jgi:hypothetical protein